MSALVLLERSGNIVRLVLNRPERHNSLVPRLIGDLLNVLEAVRIEPPKVLVLAATGRSFSTGGDIQGFLDKAREDRIAYAAELVGGLHHAIERLVALPFPVVARIQGPATGGALGFVLAADVVVMSKDAFLQPYYSEMGFAPDGGWTAMLPERVGAHRAGAIQMLNTRLSASQAQALGLVDHVFDPRQVDHVLDEVLAELCVKSAQSLAATKALLWHDARRARLAEGLAQEKSAFLSLIASEDAEMRMIQFIRRAV